MSSPSTKRSLAKAITDAAAFRSLFPESAYERWTVAGSVRRQVAQVGDIEHVVIPRFGEIEKGDGLFAERIVVNLLWHHCDRLLRDMKIAKHVYPNGSNRWGEKYRGIFFNGFNNEIFAADADNYGAILAIRTGPGDFSRMLVTVMQKNGYMNHGGYVYNKNNWRCSCGWSGAKPTRMRDNLFGAWITDPDGRDGGPYSYACPKCGTHDSKQIVMERVPVPDEQEYFKLCGVPFLEPQKRFMVA